MRLRDVITEALATQLLEAVLRTPSKPTTQIEQQARSLWGTIVLSFLKSRQLPTGGPKPGDPPSSNLLRTHRQHLIRELKVGDSLSVTASMVWLSQNKSLLDATSNSL